VFLLAVTLLATACHKNEPLPHDEPITRLIPADMKAYWDFHAGTWWAYQDSITGAVDTVKVLDDTTYKFQGTLSYNQKPAACEFLQFTAFNTGDGYTYRYWINTEAGGSSADYNVLFSDKFRPGDFVDVHRCFVYPLQVGTYTANSYGVAFDSCVVKSFYAAFDGFNDVVRIDNTVNSFEHYKRTRSYYAKNVGLIRYEVPDSNKYKILLDYYIAP